MPPAPIIVSSDPLTSQQTSTKPIVISSDPPSSSALPPSSLPSAKDEPAPASPNPTQSPSPIPPTPRSYREVIALPYELEEHCRIYFEESVHITPLNILLSNLTSGVLPPSQRPAVIAPPHFLSFIATLAAHPTLTSRAKTVERATAAALSLRYLRILLDTIRPSQTGFKDAFTFTSTAQTGRGGRVSRRRITTTEDGEDREDDDSYLKHDLANAHSLWHRGEDFWHVVGWAFNCSVLHKQRWEVWTTWLEFMLDVLEADWHERAETGRGSGSMIVNFIKGNKAGGYEKRILRSVFADGSTRSASEFREIWLNETKTLKKEEEKVPSGLDSSNPEHDAATTTKPKASYQKINIDKDDYGVYLDDEVAADLSNTSRSPSPDSSTTSNLGGTKSIALRLRLLSLLCIVSEANARHFVEVGSLYDMISEYIRSLPLPIFASIIRPSSSGILGIWDMKAAVSFVQYLVLMILDTRAPTPDSDTLDQESLELSYLPYAANSSGVVENAKVGICVEFLGRILELTGYLWRTDSLLEAAELGVEARKKKGVGKGEGRKGDDAAWLEGSAQRIMTTVRMAKVRQES